MGAAQVGVDDKEANHNYGRMTNANADHFCFHTRLLSKDHPQMAQILADLTTQQHRESPIICGNPRICGEISRQKCGGEMTQIASRSSAPTLFQECGLLASK